MNDDNTDRFAQLLERLDEIIGENVSDELTRFRSLLATFALTQDETILSQIEQWLNGHATLSHYWNFRVECIITELRTLI